MKLLRNSLSAISINFTILDNTQCMSQCMFDSIKTCTKTFNVKQSMTILIIPTRNEGKMTPTPPSPTLPPSLKLSPSSATITQNPKAVKHFSTNSTASNKPQLIQLGRRFNRFYFDGLFSGQYKPVYCQGYQIGLVRKDVEEAIKSYKDIFHVSKTRIDISTQNSATAHDNYSFDEISLKIDVALRSLRDSPNHDFVALRGWRNECYNIRPGFAEQPLFKMERSATCMFGLRQYGVDINGYVNDPEKGLCLWMQKRSLSKPTWPGKWDNFVSGGLSIGYTVRETVMKEAVEEANVPKNLLSASCLKPGGCVTFFFESERGIFPQTEFVFDLELPLEFTPKNNDGEVDEFALVPADELPSRLCLPDMKTTSCPVTIDFLIRRGIINSDTEPNLPELSELLHIPLHTIYKKQCQVTTAD